MAPCLVPGKTKRPDTGAACGECLCRGTAPALWAPLGIERLPGWLQFIARLLTPAPSHIHPTIPGTALRCWAIGKNEYGQATPPSNLSAIISVASGNLHTCAVKPTGDVLCWGFDALNRTDPPADLGPVTSLTAGWHHTCSLNATGGMRCWGSNYDGESTVPDDLEPVHSIAGGYAHTCVIVNATAGAGSLRCLGDDAMGKATPPSDLGPVTLVAAGYDHMCTAGPTGLVRCWGRNGDGESTVPSDLGPVTALTAGYWYTCAVVQSGAAVRCWGDNFNSGQTAVPKDLGPVTSILTVFRQTCAITATPTLPCAVSAPACPPLLPAAYDMRTRWRPGWGMLAPSWKHDPHHSPPFSHLPIAGSPLPAAAGKRQDMRVVAWAEHRRMDMSSLFLFGFANFTGCKPLWLLFSRCAWKAQSPMMG